MSQNYIEEIRSFLELAQIRTQGEDPQVQLTMIDNECLVKARSIETQHAVLAAALQAPEFRVAAASGRRLLIWKR